MTDYPTETRSTRSAGPGQLQQRAWVLLGVVGLALLSFTAGRLSVTTARAEAVAGIAEAPWPPGPAMTLVQNPQVEPDARELIPMPQPGKQPGQSSQSDSCPMYLYEDGQLYRFDSPGAPGGPAPGAEGAPELFPLEPAPKTPVPAPSPRRPPERPEPRPGPGQLITEAERSFVATF